MNNQNDTTTEQNAAEDYIFKSGAFPDRAMCSISIDEIDGADKNLLGATITELRTQAVDGMEFTDEQCAICVTIVAAARSKAVRENPHAKKTAKAAVEAVSNDLLSGLTK